MAKHCVEILEAFRVEIPLGPLTIHHMGSGTTDTIDEARTFVSHYNLGTIHTFSTKKAAMSFCESHGTKVRYLGQPKKGAGGR